MDRSKRVPATVRLQISRGCGEPVKVTVVAPRVLETAVAGVEAGAGVMANAALHGLPSRLTMASCWPSAMAVSVAGPLVLISCAKICAMCAWVSATSVPK